MTYFLKWKLVNQKHTDQKFEFLRVPLPKCNINFPKLRTLKSDFYKYNPKMTDLENLQMKANAKVAEILKFGTTKERAKIVGL